MIITECNTEIYTDSIFYNPHMELCRDISSLAVGSLSRLHERFEGLSLCDGMAATGIRGLRYAMENDNVNRVVLVDANKHAVPVMKKNVKRNRMGRKVHVVQDDITRHLCSNRYDVIELDPFGTPQRFIRPAISSFYSDNRIKHAVISVTATDTAVLCGAHYKACVKLYHARPLNEFACHEVGARILLANIAWASSEYDYGIRPLFTFSHRHYIKLFVMVVKGAAHAYESTRKIGHIIYKPKDFSFNVSRPMVDGACAVDSAERLVGPLWLGRLHDTTFLKQMLLLNRRGYKNERKIDKLLHRMMEESDAGTLLYYNLHKLSKKLGISAPSMQSIISTVKTKGYKAARTHFDERAIKTDMPIAMLKKVMKEQ